MSGIDSNGHLHDSEGKYAPKHNSAPGVAASLAVDGTFDEAGHDEVHDAADAWAAGVNAEGRAAQVAFLRRMRVEDADIRYAISSQEAIDPQGMDSALDDLVHEAASHISSQAYNDNETGQYVTAELENKRWMAMDNYTVRDDYAHPLELRHNEAMDVVVTASDGSKIPFRIGYNETVPNGDNGQPARGYLRGEFFAASEFSRDRVPASVSTAPFRKDNGEGLVARRYAHDELTRALQNAAEAAAAARAADPLADFLTGGA